jgi:hypothetical protein
MIERSATPFVAGLVVVASACGGAGSTDEGPSGVAAGGAAATTSGVAGGAHGGAGGASAVGGAAQGGATPGGGGARGGASQGGAAQGGASQGGAAQGGGSSQGGAASQGGAGSGGASPSCGDGACAAPESCASCPADCGACGPTCGDQACSGGETCHTCAADCQSASCPASPVAGYKEGAGLHAIDACAFPMADTGSWAARAKLVDELAKKLPTQSIAGLLGDLNRTGTTVGAVPGLASVHRGVKWESGDESVAYWWPQGLTGAGDGVAGKLGGKNVVLSSWYYKQSSDPGSNVEKGVRIAVLDPATATYRFALLVEPYDAGGTVSFKSVPIHAGGLAWYGDYLYVADTGAGLRVFDLTHVFTVATDADTIGWDAGAKVFRAYKYKYAIPQIGAYQRKGSCKPVFSFVALDRGTVPPSLVTGEYDAATIYGRLFRWSLDAASGRLGAGVFAPTEAYFMGQTNVQGALSIGGHFLLSSSAPANGGGALYRVAVGSSKTYAWSNAPEDLFHDPSTGEVWCQSEAVNGRYVYSVLASKVP